MSQQIHHFLASCLLGAAKERCLFLLVKQINADIMHCQRFFCTCKRLLLPLALLNNQLYDYLHFVAHCFFTPTQIKLEKMVEFTLGNSCLLVLAASVATVGGKLCLLCYGKVSQCIVLTHGCPERVKRADLLQGSLLFLAAHMLNS